MIYYINNFDKFFAMNYIHILLTILSSQRNDKHVIYAFLITRDLNGKE